MSIRRTLLVSLLSGLFVSALIIVCVTYFNTADEMRELFSDSMERTAVIVNAQISPQNINQKDLKTLSSDEPEESSVIQVWDDQGKLVRSSPQAAELPLQSKEGFSAVTIHSQKFRTFTLKAGNGGYVQVAQPRRVIGTMIKESAPQTIVPLLILFILLGLGAWFVVRKSLSPLSHLSRLIANQNVDQLKPISTLQIPDEIQPIVQAFNGLLKKLDQTMELQRQFTADAAHELRTPLAAIKIQAELLDRAQSSDARSEAMKKLSESIERGINLATQLLNASRSSATKALPGFHAVCFDEIVHVCIETYAPLALAKNINLVLEHCDECIIEGDEEGIRVLVNNLLDNAIRYTPAGGDVSVGLLKYEDKVILKVGDTGTGIPEDQRTKIFDRFYRIPGASSHGAGLGLSIVKDIMNDHNATILVTNGPKNTGTMFRVIFFYHPSALAVVEERRA